MTEPTSRQLLEEIHDLQIAVGRAPTEDAMRRAVAAGVRDGFQSLLADKQAVEAFWEGGFEELKKHSTNGASQWVGKRVLTWVITTIVIAGLTWLFTRGGLK